MFHHGHTGAGQREHDQTGNIKSPRVIPPRAYHIDGTIRVSLNPRIHRAGPKRRGESRQLGCRLTFITERPQEIRLFGVRNRLLRQSFRSGLNRSHIKIEALAQSVSEFGKRYHDE